ncbi:MAG: hypothetical protein COB49_06765 [Alphaproteobacteria bacterium]|nr:MAG: hypothetical protein COB49_06765 [Alphaproteobacteria bacterium]
MNGFTKLIMLISTLVLMIGGGFSFYLTYQGYQPVAPINTSEDGIAIDGFDAVAYHTAGTAQKGVANFQVTWAGSIWYFTSLENRQFFSANPEKYVPQFGGYDPFGMAMNGAAQPATPELWAIKDGRLYLFYSGKTRTFWQENALENLKKANIQWNRIKQQILYKAEMEKGR